MNGRLRVDRRARSVERKEYTYALLQPLAEAACVMQLRMQGEIPLVEVGAALLAVEDWACTPATAATTVRATALNFILADVRVGSWFVNREWS